MEQENIFAWTEHYSAGYPAYLSINKHPDGAYSITVRSRGDFGTKSVTTDIPKEALIDMADKLKRLSDASI